ncbi:hypothetical protein [Micromonospora tulbaghiae]|uniref:hypothetical protein n=1 Tax=Micromonospora tulbaghiae TaxID=479978 RepID=UPI0033E18662
MDTFSVAGKDISTAWLNACRALQKTANRRAYHTVVRIDNPGEEDLQIRGELDRILKAKQLQPIRTVANTIFPTALAKVSRSHDELVRRYHNLYPTLRRTHPGNAHGTYFGRMVNYPSANGIKDQIGAIIERLRRESAGRGGKTACYEATIGEPALDTPDIPVPIRVVGLDNSTMGFPCLSHCSFQLDRNGRIHLMAFYRSHYMVERAYGNYLGLSDLLAHVATHSRLEIGSITVAAGYAQLDNNCITALRPILTGTAPLFAA